MSAAAPVFLPPPHDPPRKRFTRADVDQMEEAGLFAGLRYELIEGDLIDKMGAKPPHSASIRLATAALAKRYGLLNLRAQLPLEVADPDRVWSFPEPDLVAAPCEDGRFDQRDPQGHEVWLLVEVSDTTLRHDRTTKRDIYARAGVPRYAVLDVKGRQVFLYERPVDGAYTATSVLTESDQLDETPVKDLLPPVLA